MLHPPGPGGDGSHGAQLSPHHDDFADLPGPDQDSGEPGDGELQTAAPPAPVTQACSGCGSLLDISEQDPLARIHCPVCGTGLDVRRQYGNFSIVEKLGEGGMGTVYKALDVNLNRMVALKLLRREFSADPEYIAKLEEEARVTASINHPHVVKVFSFGEDGGQYYLALELVDKGSLDDLMQLQGRVAEIQVLKVGRQIAEGLKAAHERGLIHRDVKPGNMLFADARTAKVTDFGLALLAEHEAESRGEIWGTPYYIAPEKLNHEPEDFRSDIYSLGGTLFHACAGRPPFEAENASLVALKHLKSQAVSLQAFAPDVAPETAYVINRMLHKDPGERYQSYDELIEHLQYAADQLAAKAGRPRVARERVVEETEGGRRLAGILTLALLVLLAAGGALAWVLRDRLFGRDARGVIAERQRREAELRKTEQGSVEEHFQESRQQLLKESFASAQDGFSELTRRAGLTRPQGDWARFHLILTSLLNQDLENAQAVADTEAKAGLFSREESDRPLANSLDAMAKAFGKPSQAVPASTANLFKPDGAEAFAPLLFGLKNLELGVTDDALRLLQAFLEAKPTGAYRWIADYRPLAEKRVQDLRTLAALRERLKGADTAQKQAALLAEFERAKGQLQTSDGKMVELFNASAGVLRSQLETTRKDEAGGVLAREAAQNDADKGRWQAARETAQSALRLFRYEEALATLKGLSTLRGADFVAARDALAERATRLAGFKRLLVADLNAGAGRGQPFPARNGTAYPQGIARADASAGLLAVTPRGEAPLAWTDVDPRALVGLATRVANAKAAADPRAAAERRWLAATFAQEAGLFPEARALAEQAAKDRPEYRDKLGTFK